MSTPEHVRALEKTKIALMTKPDSVFFCEVAFSLKYVWKEDIPTAATDGIHIFMNPQFFMEQTPEQRLGLLLHECLHPVYMHLTRRGNRQPHKWNIAADHVINLVILDRGFKLPDGGHHDKQYTGMTTEQIYDLLPDPPEPDETIDLLPSELPQEELEQQLEEIIVRAAIRSEQEGDTPGTIPGDIQLFLDKLLKPKLPWNQILIKYLAQFNKSDYTFKKPNKRFFPQYHLPSQYSTCLIDIAVAVDISGSVSDDEFKTFISEIASIFRMMKPNKLTLIQFDTVIHSIDELDGIRDLMQVQFHGRGGTAIEPVIEWAELNKPQLLLFFTDGYFKTKINSTKQEILWLIHNHPKFTIPFGKVIHYQID